MTETLKGKKVLAEYAPYYAVSPGEILKEELEYRKIELADFAEQTKLSLSLINKIIEGEEPVTKNISKKFGKALGTSVALWDNLEMYYQLYKKNGGG